MANLAELTAAGDSQTLDGFTLSPFGLADYGECEAEFARQHIAECAGGAAGLSVDLQDKVIKQATADVRAGAFAWGSRGFDGTCMRAAMLPYLLRTCLRIKHPDVTLVKAKALLTRENETAVQIAVLKCMGFDMTATKPKKTEQAPADQAPDGPSTGESSSEPSANAASVGPTPPG